MKKIVFVLALILCASTSTWADVQIDLPKQIEIQKTTDVTATVMEALFGEAWVTIAGKPTANLGFANPFGELIVTVASVMNLAALTYLSLLIMYMWGIFAVSTAHEGKKLGGGTYNSLWVPVRHASAFALTVPVLKGLSLLQVAVLSCVSLSINFANVIWDASSKFIAENAQANVIAVANGSLQEEALSLLPMMFQAAVFQELDKIQIPDRESYYAMNSDDGSGNLYQTVKGKGVITLYTKSPKTAEKGLLGSVSYPYPTSSSDSDDRVKVQQELADARIAAAKQLWEGARGLATAYLSTPYATHSIKTLLPATGETGQDYKELVKNYVSSVEEALKAAQYAYVSTDSKVQDMISRSLDYKQGQGTTNGWAGAGMYQFALASLQKRLDQTILGRVTYTPVDVKGISEGFGGGSNYRASRKKSWFLSSDTFGWKPDYEKIFERCGHYFSTQVLKNTSYSAKLQGEREEWGGWFDKLSNLLFLNPVKKGGEAVAGAIAIDSDNSGTYSEDTTILATVLQQFSTTDPLVVIQAFGDRLVTASYWIFGGSAASGIIGGMLEKFAGVGSMVSGTLTILAVAFFSVGVLMAFVAPITPFIYWLRAILTWIFLVIESIVAAPFWAVVHALPRGEGFAGDAARKGYLMLIDIAIRPVLLVLGAVFAISIVRVTGWFVYKTLNVWFSTAGSFIEMGLTADIVFSIIVISTMYSLVHLCYTKGITFLPEKVSKWIGGAEMGGGLGSDDGMAEQSSKVVMVASGHVTSMANASINRLQGAGKPQKPKLDDGKDSAGKQKGEIGPGMAPLPASPPKDGGGGHGAAKPGRAARGSAGEGILGNAGLSDGQGGGGTKPAGTGTASPASPAPPAGAGGDLGQGIADAGAAAGGAASGQGQGQEQGQGQGMAGGRSRAAWENLLGPGLARKDG